MTIVLRQATLPAEIEAARELFLEYQRSLGIDLCFQGFQQELAALPGPYAPPQGRLYLAMEAGEAVGCVAMRDLGGGVAEMKRLYLRPSHRGQHVGRLMAQRIAGDAKATGYQSLVLDTLPSMTEARALYASLGFADTTPYTANPVQGARFLKLSLGQ
ncbi:MAG: GNAT family N-acetyltransferase [Burkholderiales bacterium]